MSLSRNIPLVAVRNFFAMFLVLIPVLVPYWQSLGLSMKEILELQALFGLSVALFEIPTGYLADKWSRKGSLVVGSFISAVSFSYLPLAKTYESLAFFEVAVALGCSFASGADIALMYDSLPRNVNRSKILGTISLCALVGEAVASLLGGLLVLQSFSAVLWTQAVVMWLPFFLALFFVEPPIERIKHSSHLMSIVAVARLLVFSDSLMRLIFFNSLVWGLSSFCIVWLLQPYWAMHEVPLSYFGAFWAGLMLVSAFSSKAAHRVEAALGASNTLLILATSACLGYFLMSSNLPVVGVMAGTLFYITRGLSSVILVDAFNWKTPQAIRATANSMSSLAFRLGFAVLGPAIGWSIAAYGLSSTLFLMGGFFTLMVVMLMIPLCKRIEELHVEYIPE